MLLQREIHPWIFIILTFHSITGGAFNLSWNQPKLCPNALWNSDGNHFATAADRPYGLFVHRNNYVYATEQDTNRVQVWSERGISPIRSISSYLHNPGAIFVNMNGDIYVDNGGYQNVQLWTPDAATGTTVMNVATQCLGLFLDISNTLFCSISDHHKVVTQSLNTGLDYQKTVAGNGSCLSSSSGLCLPNGIFVDTELNLYVADWYYNRIQKFTLGSLIGETVAGYGAVGTTDLSGPTAVTLDADNYLFIVDMRSDRIVGSGPNGFRCIVGCTEVSQLDGPRSLAFDSHGNLLVTDRQNNRILKFELVDNSCDMFTPSTTAITHLGPCVNAGDSILNNQQLCNNIGAPNGFLLRPAYWLFIVAFSALV